MLDSKNSRSHHIDVQKLPDRSSHLGRSRLGWFAQFLRCCGTRASAARCSSEHQVD